MRNVNGQFKMESVNPTIKELLNSILGVTSAKGIHVRKQPVCNCAGCKGTCHGKVRK